MYFTVTLWCDIHDGQKYIRHHLDKLTKTVTFSKKEACVCVLYILGSLTVL